MSSRTSLSSPRRRGSSQRKKWITAFAGMATTLGMTMVAGMTLLLFSHSGFAATALEEISVIEKQSLVESPSSFTTTIDLSRHQKRFFTLKEVLKESPALIIKETGGLGGLSTISIRGSTAEQVAVYLDGIKLNTASRGVFDFSTIPLQSLERIEVIRGGKGARYGSNAIGGVILLHSKSHAKKRRFHFEATSGSFLTLQTSESWFEPGKENNILLSHTHLSSRGDFNFKTLPVTLAGAPSSSQVLKRHHNSFYSEDLFFKWDHQLTNDLKNKLSFNGRYADKKLPGTTDEMVLLAPANPQEASSQDLIFSLANRFEWKKEWEWGLANHFEKQIFKDPTPAIGGPINVTSHNNGLNLFGKWKRGWDLSLAQLLLTTGIDYRFDFFEAGRVNQRHTSTLFVEPSFSFFQDRLVFTPIGRFENANDFPHQFLGGFGIEYLLASPVVVKANVNQSFRYPNFNELYFPDQGFIRGNSALQPEEALNIDGGLKFQTEYFFWEVAYFRHLIENSILFVPISAFTISPVNTLKATEQGVEFAFGFDLSKYAKLKGNYTWLDAHFNGNRNRLPGRSEHLLNASLMTKIWRLNSHFNIQHRSGYPVNTSNTISLSSRTSMDASVSYEQKKWYATLEAKNLTGVQIYDNQGFPLPRRSFFIKVGVNI